MRIKSISATNVLPVKAFQVDNLSDLIVIAGANGVGKTRLVSGLLGHFRGKDTGQVAFEIEATDDAERTSWGKAAINSGTPDDLQKLRGLLQQNRSRRNFKSSVLYYESNRSIQKVQPLAFQFEFSDPYEEQIGWDVSFGGLSNRWQDTQHAIFKKIQSQKMSIATRAIQLRSEGHSTMNLEFSDPLDTFREAFSRLLGPKTLHSADVQNQRLLYSDGPDTREVSSLSSGEREVLNIAFDFLLRKPSHCIVFFDEPELHLHPELLARLISTLRAAGENNQFIFISHSPDVVSASLNDSVIFLTPPKPSGENQAVMLGSKQEASEALHRLGHSVGVVSLGKKIVLIEGTESSLDKQTYSYLLKNRFPSLVLQASGGKGNLQSFNRVATEVLDRTLWGIRFYMLADRDAVPSEMHATLTATDRFRVLQRYHLENYFLDSEVLAECFRPMEAHGSWLRSPDEIDKRLRFIAQSQLGYAVALIQAKRLRDAVGNVDLMPSGAHSMDRTQLVQTFTTFAASERGRVAESLDAQAVSAGVQQTFDELSTLLKRPDNAWKEQFPGKPILSIFAQQAKIPEGRLKNLYLAHAEERSTNPFFEIIDVFRQFELDGVPDPNAA